MKTVLQASGALALSAFAYLCLSLSFAVRSTSKHIATVSMQVGDTLSKLDKEIDEAHRLTLEAGLTAMEARKASAKESEYLDQWNSEITLTFGNVNAAVASLSSVSAATVSTLQATQETVSSLQAPIQSADQTLTEARKAIEALQPVIAHTDALVSDPALAATLSNVAGTTSHLDATAADVQETVHSYTHPTWAHKLFSWSLDIAHALNPL